MTFSSKIKIFMNIDKNFTFVDALVCMLKIFLLYIFCTCPIEEVPNDMLVDDPVPQI